MQWNHYNIKTMIYNNILEAIGHTPLIQLQKMVTPDMARVLVKFEGLNVGGSIKTRTAFNMILDAERRGLIDKNTVSVEPTSGNQGIGLALIGAVRGYKTVIIMPDSVSEERRKLVKHYGADIGFWRVLHDIFVALAVFWHEAENTVCETATKEINAEDCAIVYG